MSGTRGGRANRPGPHRSITGHAPREPQAAGILLGEALLTGYRPYLSSIAYTVPRPGSCALARAAWQVQCCYALAPDLVADLLRPRRIPHASSDVYPHGAAAVASNLVDPHAPFHVSIAASWTQAMSLIATPDIRIRVGLHLAALGNPYPLAARYNELQPYVCLDAEPPPDKH